MAAYIQKLFPRALEMNHLLLEDLDPNQVYVNNDIYDNNDIVVRYAQALDPWRWTRGWVHAMGMASFLCGIIAIYVVLYLQDLRIDAARLRVAIGNADKFTRNQPAYVHRAFTDRMSTHLRAFTYKRRHSWIWRRGLGGMSLGMAVTVLVGWLYPTLYTFTQHPYYHVYARYGPPGLASRAGMIAVATIPFIIALGMKANWISLVTGVGHERLNVLHRWLGLLCLFFSLVHTIPFLVEPVKGDWGDGTGSWAALRDKLLYGKGSIYYWNGFAALGCILWMNIASLPFFRRWRYEFFVHIHIFTGVGTLAMLFWHCYDQLSSWHYLWATVVIWVTSLAWRFLFKTNWFSSSGKWFSGDTGTFTRLTDDGVKITITTRMRWHPGQHVFLRIPAVSYLDNHPFTVASVMREEDDLPSPSSGNTMDTTTHLKQDAKNDRTLAKVAEKRFGKSDKVAEWNDMVLVFKPYKGFTRKVFDISRQLNDISYKVLLDGPYGGMPRKLESFDTVLLIAGGSGITPVVAHLQDLCRKIRKGKAVTTDVRIVWTVKRFESLEWFKDEISAAARSVPFGLVHCQYFVTEESPVEFCDYPISATQQWPTSPAAASMKSPFHDSLTGDDDGQPPMPALPGTAVTTPERVDYFPPADFPAISPQYPQERKSPIPAIAQESQTPHAQSVKTLTTPIQTTFTAPDTRDILDSHPNPFTTPVGAADCGDYDSHHAHLEITDSHPNPFSSSTGYHQEKIPSAPEPGLAAPNHSKKPSLRVSTIPEFQPEQTDGIFRVASPPPSAGAPRPNIAPDGHRLSYGPGDFGDEVMIEFGRPRLREGIRPWAEGFGRRTCIYVCGPETMKIDVSNAVAGLQHDIWRRENQDREEVYLHTETFGW
ncbi:hypothetical protein L211DRAFT_215110 [Terfezia boudieri ATCC MYA-4762]|uniref:ferric-chelate reductase (NADPH) n=1 Tax=Terfezia boudieri ATCC MYA-4762 TaxID=1051890 RepID=A0A3N4LR97_9PEZI|nr:hypothetical protein L211DRAFT_215110 [Terfezia boudieri ATCC MYA-4762]